MSDIATTLRKICAAFNARDLDQIMAFFADDCALEMPRGPEPWGTRYEGKDTCAEAWQLASKIYLMCPTAMLSTSSIRRQTPACRNVC